ncbi:hypothetical protein CPB97_008149 [Podila verticillata]|nr:hypothetical protein CPB97_008149 [Podila verticillata]
MRATIIILALLGAALSPSSIASGAAISYRESTHTITSAISLGANDAQNGAFFEPLTDSLSNFNIPDNTSPAEWACSYVRQAVGDPNTNGTAITIAKDSTRKPFSCGELVYNKPAQYGIYSVDIISTNVHGHITGFFLIVNGVSEIDVELTGINSTVVWLNIWKGSQQSPRRIPLGFDAAEGFHTYQIEWREDFIAWSVDGKEILRRSDITTVDPTKNYYRLVLNSWIQAADNEWAGKFEWPGKPFHSEFKNLRYTP